MSIYDFKRSDYQDYKKIGANFPVCSNLLTKTLTMKNLTFS